MNRAVLVILTLVFGLGACSRNEGIEPTLGMVEGLNSHIAPIMSGPIVALDVHEGEDVKAGQSLFAIDPRRAQAALNNAQAALRAGEAQLADLLAAGRPAEIRAAQDAVTQTRAQARLAQENYERTSQLVAQGQLPKARLDTDRANRDAANAALSQAQARLTLIKEPARPDRIEQARAQITGLQAQLSRAQLDLADTKVTAPVDGRIESIYRRVGEIAGPVAPVLALLPPDQIRIRFYVGEGQLAAVHPGESVHFSCDGCAADLTGTVYYISDKAEFTPPFIFTAKERARFKYMVEAKPDQPLGLHPGQPVDVTW